LSLTGLCPLWVQLFAFMQTPGRERPGGAIE
jgi:hypothetical protein